MKSNANRYSLFINSLLSNKEILIKESKDIQITECSVFRQSKTIIPLDLVSTDVKEGYKPDLQWLFFSIVNVVGVIVFATLAISQGMTFPFVLAGVFALVSVMSVFAAYKYKNAFYTFKYNDSDTKLFTLTSSDLNSAQVKEFTNVLVSLIQKNDQIGNANIELDKIEIENNLTKDDSVDNETPVNRTGALNYPLENYSEHLSFLYDEGIIDDVLLDRLQKTILNKLYGSKSDNNESQGSSNVIPFRSHRTDPLPQTAE